jgi:hypothetical protein
MERKFYLAEIVPGTVGAFLEPTVLTGLASDNPAYK